MFSGVIFSRKDCEESLTVGFSVAVSGLVCSMVTVGVMDGDYSNKGVL